MAITNGFITLDEYAQYLGYQTPIDSVKRADVEWAVEVASEAIRQFCGRWFLTETAGARYYDSDTRTSLTKWLNIDDATAITEVAVDTTDTGVYAILAATDYQLLPVGGRSTSLGSVPYNAIQRLGSYWPTINGNRRGRVKVTGTWGWAAVPEPIKRACAIFTQDLLRDKEAVFGGIMSTAEGITIMSRMPRRVSDLCTPYRRVERVGPVIA